MPAEMYLPHFVVKQKLTMMVNRYEISESDEAGNPTRLMALAEQKRLAFKEQVTFWSDAGKSRPVVVGAKVDKPTPVFTKLDPSVVEEELARVSG